MSSTADTDSLLMQRVRQGDREAFTALVEKYQQPVINFVARTLGDPTEAEDLSQAVFVQVYKAAHRFDASARFSTWLFTIARNLCLNELRRRSRHPAESMDAQHPDDDESSVRQFKDTRQIAPPETLLHTELTQKIQASLNTLPENQRTAIVLCQQEDLSYEDIAKVLKCSVSATKSLIFRGRETLKQKLKPYLKSGHWEDS